MIIDKIDNMPLYKNSTAWLKAMDFLKNISADCEDGEYEIEGESVFARVMTYDTKPLQEAFPEAHIKYLDIQTVLSGKELAMCLPLGDLDLKTPYDDQTDLAFYYPKIPALSEIILTPGYFAVFFPEDAHMPSISINASPCRVKKVVIKIAVDVIDK